MKKHTTSKIKQTVTMGELCPEWDPGPPPLVRLLSRFVQLTRHKNFAIVTILLSICATAFAIPSCGTFKHTVRPPAATAFSRSSSSTRTTTHHSFISSLSGPIGPTTKNDSMGAVGAAAAASASHPALVASSPPLLRSKGIRQHRAASCGHGFLALIFIDKDHYPSQLY